MTTTHPSPSVKGPYATYDLPTTSVLWATAMVNFKTSPTDRATAYGMEVATEKSKIKTNSTNISVNISMNGQTLEMTSFKYLGATLYKYGTCSAEVRIRIASEMARLNGVRRCNTISLASKFKFYKSFVTSICLYGCETWALLADSEKRIQAFETKCLRKLLRISHMERKTNDWVWRKINFLMALEKPLQATVK